MASDGVIGRLYVYLFQCLAAHSCQPPAMLAETVLRAVERDADPQRRDDMTALCARIALRRGA